MAYRTSNPLTFIASVERETAKAIQLRWDGDSPRATVWVPKSVITYNERAKTNAQGREWRIVTIKEWFKRKLMEQEAMPEDCFVPRNILKEYY